MIVYVESNFVLELALLQEQHASADAILAKAESGEIRLAFPAFSISEPYDVWMRRSNDKQRFSQEFAKHVRELSRSSPYAGPLQSSQQISETFTQSIDEEKSRLDTVLTRLLACAEIIPTDAVILRDSLSHRTAFDLSAKDSIVFASVLTHLVAATGPKCFLTRDKVSTTPTCATVSTPRTAASSSVSQTD